MNTKISEPCSVRIRKALSIRNMRQADLCEKAGISKSTLSEYLSGRYVPKQDKIFLISQVLNVDPVWLMGYDVPMEKQAQPDIKKVPHTEDELNEGEKLVLQLFRQIPEDKQSEALDLLRVALRMQQKP
jgi:transcriptional regulator with XRE-family HTH domain